MTHTYAAAGAYAIALVVIDGAGRTDSTSQSTTIS